MKKYLSLILTVSLVFCFTSCRKLTDKGSEQQSIIEDFVYVSDDDRSEQQKDDKTQSESSAADKPQKAWESTVIAPSSVVFYKDGMQSVSTDKELNHKIAKHIEEWYKEEYFKDYHANCVCILDESYIADLRDKEMAIQLEFDNETKVCGGFVPSSVRTVFIPLTGKDEYKVFAGGKGPGSWSHLNVKGSGLEQYFENRRFEPMPELRSTVTPPWKIQLYQNGNMLGEYKDVDFNYKIAQHIESWYRYKEGANQTTDGITDETITNIRNNDTYIELFFSGEIKFFDKNIILPETKNLLIPLTGDRAYHIFEADKNFNYACFSFCENANGLEQFFKEIKTSDNG